jgi:hypothetical protein
MTSLRTSKELHVIAYLTSSRNLWQNYWTLKKMMIIIDLICI